MKLELAVSNLNSAIVNAIVDDAILVWLFA